jgi:nucleotidyltransferase substrate binding protein (TIGR01987 family)
MRKRDLESFKKSLERLKESAALDKTIIIRDSVLKRFEFTAELAWKTIKRFLREKEIDCLSPRECLEEAFKNKLIEDDELWISMIKDRNIIVHNYNEEVSDIIYERIVGKYIEMLDSLKDKLEEFNKL